ncbi:MAG TPA: hypothetical protein ENK85_00390 [Saprospiraceae bacterium]|nr:hypothetical protein [Saprospiraceae bacterium]
MINRQNYEIWFLDYSEGNLSEKKINYLMDFLDKNQDLKAEFNDLDLIQLPPDDSFTLPGKNKLKRPILSDIHLSQEDKWLIAELEGDLTPNEKIQLDKLLRKQPHHLKDRKIYQATTLSPDLSIKYPNKKDLMHRDHKIFPWRMVLQLAAAILLLAAMIFALRKEDNMATPSKMPIVQTPNLINPTQQKLNPTQKIQPINQEILTPQSPTVPRKEQELVQSPVEPSNPILRKPKNKSVHLNPPKTNKEVFVSQDQPTPTPPQIQTPPKPRLKPELPQPKPVLAHQNTQEPSPNTHVNETPKEHPTKRLIALNKPKDFIKKTIHKGVKKIVQDDATEKQVTLPEAIVSTIGTVTKKKTSYKKENTQNTKRLSISIGGFKFSRVKHRTR